MEIPKGFCQCGCGKRTNIATHNRTKPYTVKGEYYNFALGHYIRPSVNRPELFWSKVKVLGPDDCWPWMAALDGKGYGVFGVPNLTDRAHRYSFYLATGHLTPGLEVCHSCDHPSCVNPKHLFEGTQLENMRDCVSKGRHRHGDVNGENNPRAKLTETQVREIRNLNEQGMSWGKLATMYGVSKRVIGLLLHRKTWKYVQ